MHIIALGLNHNSASIELREGVAVPDDQLQQRLSLLRDLDQVREGVILSTCNRTELYVVTGERLSYDEQILGEFLASLHGLRTERLAGHLYCYRDEDAVTHLMEVAAGLDSMMLGEYQIMSQIKAAYSAAQTARTTDAVLNSLFQSALNIGKRVRTETEISRGAFSVGAAAVEFATRIFGENLSTQSVLILGAGQISELTARHLQARGVSRVFVTNRTLERAENLASQLENARAVPFDALSEYLAKADIVICSTAAVMPVITKDLLKLTMRVRRNRPLYIVDIAVPRDVEVSAGQLENVFLYNIDDLSQVVSRAQQERKIEVKKAKQIVDEAAAEHMRWRQSLDATPLIISIRERLESLRLDEIARLRAKLPHLEEREMKAIEQSLQSFSNKIAHDAILAVKESTMQRDATGYARISAIMSSFGLSEVEEK